MAKPSTATIPAQSDNPGGDSTDGNTAEHGEKSLTNKDTGGSGAKPLLRGKPKSGRLWKSVRQSRHSEMKKDDSLKSSWSAKMQQKATNKSIKMYERELKEARTTALEEKRKRNEQHAKRRLENQKKSEVVQVIKNSSKIKRMKKKQLRMIAKR